jgi:hypothetical protein
MKISEISQKSTKIRKRPPDKPMKTHPGALLRSRQISPSLVHRPPQATYKQAVIQVAQHLQKSAPNPQIPSAKISRFSPTYNSSPVIPLLPPSTRSPCLAVDYPTTLPAAHHLLLARHSSLQIPPSSRSRTLTQATSKSRRENNDPKCRRN